LLARILELGGERDAERAAAHYRRAVQLRPDRADWLADFGLFLVARADLGEGLWSLRRAAALAPRQVAVISKIAQGLDRAGCRTEALWLLWAARANHPDDPQLTELWDAFLERQGADQPGRHSSLPPSPELPSPASDAPSFISRRAVG
jgi:Flp pilus assembly protein TadD